VGFVASRRKVDFAGLPERFDRSNLSVDSLPRPFCFQGDSVAVRHSMAPLAFDAWLLFHTEALLAE
jgi:hypothetical protein